MHTLMTKESDEALQPRRKTVPSSSQTPAATVAPSSRGRFYRTIAAEGSTPTWVTRDIAALDFLLGIPMEAEPGLVRAGWKMQQQPDNNEDMPLVTGATGRWWEKYVKGEEADSFLMQMRVGAKANKDHEEELEQPDLRVMPTTTHLTAPGRRLDGDDAIPVKIPQSGMVESKTTQRSIARQAAIREWETRVALGLDFGQPPLLDGRVFFSARKGYPMSTFSLVRYEPKREEAARRRQKLEELGGGGSQFVIPERDWRGTSYRALLPRVEKKNKSFNRFLHRERDKDDETGSDSDIKVSTSSDESDEYVPGFLDDPEMVKGRHRHVMIGDRVTGCIVSSTILYVDPEELKADLNKQFRQRFDGWEPPKSKWKYIGAKVIDGVYTLSDPTDDHDEWSKGSKERKSSVPSSNSSIDEKDTLRMPPSLTLSKIRSLKQEALMAAVSFKMEVSTVALACIYFERLCLDTRVDKSNRRMTFAACLLLAAKINENNVRVDIQSYGGNEDEGKISRVISVIKPSKASRSMFASLLEFFAHDWSLSLKTLFAAEWGVFAALGFSLHTTPSQVAFHFKRMMKVLEWSPLTYLGPEMYSQWQESLNDDDLRRKEHEERKEQRRARKERKLLKKQRKRLQLENDTKERDSDVDSLSEKQKQPSHEDEADDSVKAQQGDDSPSRKKMGPMNFLLRLKRPMSAEKLDKLAERHAASDHRYSVREKQMPISPSLPVLARRHSGDATDGHIAINMNDFARLRNGDASEAHVAISINDDDDADDESSAVSDGALMF